MRSKRRRTRSHRSPAARWVGPKLRSEREPTPIAWAPSRAGFLSSDTVSRQDLEPDCSEGHSRPPHIFWQPSRARPSPSTYGYPVLLPRASIRSLRAERRICSFALDHVRRRAGRSERRATRPSEGYRLAVPHVIDPQDSCPRPRPARVKRLTRRAMFFFERYGDLDTYHRLVER